MAAVAAMTASATAAPLTFTANAMNTTAQGVSVPAAPGSSFENATKFPNINFTFSQYGVQCGDELQLTSDKGYNKSIELNHMFYDGKMDPNVIVKKWGCCTFYTKGNFYKLNICISEK